MATIKTISSRSVLMPDGTATMFTMHITADTVSDIPAPGKNWDAGSRCDVLADGGKTYLLSNAGQWEEVHFFDRGGSNAPVTGYTKSEMDALLGQKADKSEITESVTAAVAQIVADAPEDFDTLKEMSDWIAQHEDSAAAMNTAILQNAADIRNDAENTALNRSTLGYQSKNLLVNKCQSTTKNGVISTVNEDGSITFSGSNTTGGMFVFYWNIQTGSSSTNFAGNKKWLPNGRYIVSGGRSGISVQIRYSVDNASDTPLATSSNGSEPAFSVTDSYNYVWSRILIGAAVDLSEPITIYPMIRLAEVEDSTYEPYKPSVQEQIDALTDRIAALESSQIDMVTSQNMSNEINTMNVEDEKHERTENLEQAY